MAVDVTTYVSPAPVPAFIANPFLDAHGGYVYISQTPDTLYISDAIVAASFVYRFPVPYIGINIPSSIPQETVDVRQGFTWARLMSDPDEYAATSMTMRWG